MNRKTSEDNFVLAICHFLFVFVAFFANFYRDYTDTAENLALNAGNLSIMLVNFDPYKSSAHNALALSSVTWLQTNKQGFDINCQK